MRLLLPNDVCLYGTFHGPGKLVKTVADVVKPGQGIYQGFCKIGQQAVEHPHAFSARADQLQTICVLIRNRVRNKSKTDPIGTQLFCCIVVPGCGSPDLGLCAFFMEPLALFGRDQAKRGTSFSRICDVTL